jgi:hypothetical protein
MSGNDKRTSLFRQSVNHGKKKFYNVGSHLKEAVNLKRQYFLACNFDIWSTKLFTVVMNTTVL